MAFTESKSIRRYDSGSCYEAGFDITAEARKRNGHTKSGSDYSKLFTLRSDSKANSWNRSS